MSAKYYPGEIEVQERASVRSSAEHVGKSIHPTIPPAATWVYELTEWGMELEPLIVWLGR